MAGNTIGQALFGGASGLGGVGATGPTTDNRYGPVGHGSSEQVTGRRSRFGIGATSAFGLTPPGSRSGTPPPRSTTRPARTPSSRRRARDERSESRDRARSREDRARTRTGNDNDGNNNDDNQPLPTGWGARMLMAERKITTQADQIKNLTAIVEAANATILQRVQLHETKTVEIEGRILAMETSIPERLFRN